MNLPFQTFRSRRSSPLLVAAMLAAAWPTVAMAQEEPAQTQIAIGPQFVPRYPGASGTVLRPYIDVTRSRASDPIVFEAPDESIGLSLLERGGFAIGPALGFEGQRREQDAPGVRPVGFSVELGGFAQYTIADTIRLRTELRQGVSGHEGLVANLSADYVSRVDSRQVFSIGPRMTLSDGRYQRAYFGVSELDAARSGLPIFDADGGIQSIGATAGLTRALTPRWGVLGYVKYDRLVRDAERSPVVRRFGSRDQLSTGIALSYTFGPVGR